MSRSKKTDRNAHILRISFSGGPSDQRQRLSSAPTSSVFSIQESSERLSHVHPATPTVSRDNDRPGAVASTTGDSSSIHYQRNEPSRTSSPTTTSPYIQPETGHSVISHQVLPTYRQASMSEEGITPSGRRNTGTELSPHHLDSSVPDILYSHIVPRPPPVRPNQHRHQRTRNRPEEAPNRENRQRQRTSEDRSGRQRGHSSWTLSTSSSHTQEGTCKEPCVKCVVTITSFRWVLVVLSILGVCCVVTGIVLAALHAAGQSFLFLAIMFIGLGVLLVIVVGVGWKCTPRGHEPLHALFGIGSFVQGHSRSRRRRRHRNRERNWFGGVLYPEFQFRRPPPSYAASMQEYQNQVMPEPNESSVHRNSAHNNGGSTPSSPPPSYRSRASTGHSGIHAAFPGIRDGDQPSSRPPTYRSRAPSCRPSFPLEYNVELGVSEIEVEVEPSPDVSSVASSGVLISPRDAQTERLTSSSTLSYLPTAGCSVTEASSDNLSSKPTYSMASQIYTLTSERSMQTNSINSTVPSVNTHNLISDFSTSASSTYHQQNFASTSQSGMRPPSLHQRMASEDRVTLEQTLQSLDEHMNESVGIENEGASLDE